MITVNPLMQQGSALRNEQIERKITDQVQREGGNGAFRSMLQESIGDVEKKPVDQKLMDTCEEMESIFMGKMFKQMRDNVQKTKWLHGGFAEDVFSDMLYDQYALSVSKNSKLGMAEMIYKELSGQR